MPKPPSPEPTLMQVFNFYPIQFELSGYLLRKFKSSCGWQKLWTVFTDFTLFFYKSAEDVTPLASLPLLGYRLESPRSSTLLQERDAQLHKPDILRLAYKSHVYYFRTDGPISYERFVNHFHGTNNSASQVLLIERMFALHK